MAVRHLSRERIGLGGLADEPEPVTQPLDRGAGDEDRAFHRVGRLSADAVSGRRQQAVPRRDRRRAGVEQQEAARAVSGLRHAGLEAGLAEERRLLVAGDAGDRDPGAEENRLRRAEDAAAVADFRQHRARHAGRAAAARRPSRRGGCRTAACARHWSRRSRGPPAGQPPEQEAVDRAEGERAALGARPRAGHVVEQPARASCPRSTGRAAGRCAGAPGLSAPSALSLAQVGGVRRSCQTMARWIGRPLARSQTSVVSRWLVMPIAAMSARQVPSAGAPGGRSSTSIAPDVLGVVLDPAVGG